MNYNIEIRDLKQNVIELDLSDFKDIFKNKDVKLVLYRSTSGGLSLIKNFQIRVNDENSLEINFRGAIGFQ
jgi:cell division GTPase FtsZ